MKAFLIAVVFVYSVNATSIDWCEYWARVGKKSERPECAGYELPNKLRKSEVQCPRNEVYSCLDCEPTCQNLVPKCRKVRRRFATIFTIHDTRVQRSVQEQCNRGCVCKTGFARNAQKVCVQFRECVNYYPVNNAVKEVEPHEEGTVMQTVKKMVPVIVNDVWKAFFNSIRDNLKRNYRVSGEVILLEVVRQLEEDNDELKKRIFNNANRWIPLLIASCGHPLSNMEKSERCIILGRLWKQIERNMKMIPVWAWNAKFEVLNENEADWNEVAEMENLRKHGTEPDIHTFHFVIDKVVKSGDIEACRNMVYDMARNGFSVDKNINASMTYCFSIRGHYAKADSLIEASTKYGEFGESLAHGAAARAAACRGDKNRLRVVLRRCVDEKTKRLQMSTEDIFETIWHLAEKSHDGTGSECEQLIEQMLNCTSRNHGFFRKMFREVERHISHRHYYSALALLEDTKRVSDCLENQQRSLFLYQLLGRLASQLIRNHEPAHLIRDIANRVHFAFNGKRSKFRVRIYDDLLFAALMLKDLNLEDRIEYFRTFVDDIDAKRERIHISLPLISSESEIDQRLAIIFRLSSMGYKDWSSIDIEPLINIILQPIYDHGRPRRDMSRLDKVGRILKSYGISDKNLWMMMFNWSKKRAFEEHRKMEELWEKPYSRDLRGWCKAYYSSTYDVPKSSKKSPVRVPYEKFKSCVEQGDIAKVASILSSAENGGGWPTDTNFEEIVPKVIELYLNHESWKNVKNMLINLSSLSSTWNEEPVKTPVKNFHLLMILRRMAEEEEKFSVRQLTDYAYELRNLFPYALSHYESFFESQNEYKKLFALCFERLEKVGLTPSSIDELIDFLRCLVKIELIQLHPSETLTVFFINIVLKRVGWEEALNTWQKFLSGLHCPNGTVALLRHCLYQNTDEARTNMQYVIHRGSTFLSKSRIAVMHIAVLIGMRKYEDAEKACDICGDSIDSNDCLMAMKLMNSLKSRSLDEQFMLDFAAICLRRLRLSQNKEAAQNMQADLLRICDSKQMGPTALRVYELFSDYEVALRHDEKSRLAAAIEKHSMLAKKWMLKPNGFLNLTENDEIITNSDEARIEKKLKKELNVTV
ncbi:unnamed protein product [Caenorhabditis bovis]|uniref:Uncharacterized protein n=1 Tax=Caenorhabditis bovis TaxID=2654633 RepID=A0A8S1E405_9PELO|nr:unnamed protein product [Caenorhabditis bovis]